MSKRSNASECLGIWVYSGNFFSSLLGRLTKSGGQGGQGGGRGFWKNYHMQLCLAIYLRGFLLPRLTISNVWLFGILCIYDSGLVECHKGNGLFENAILDRRAKSGLRFL
jgi:hypothetical protein